MQLKDILTQVKNNGGLTLNKNLQQVNNNKGYYVSIAGREVVFDNLKKLTSDMLKEYQKTTKDNAFIGFWLDNQKLYLDNSVLVKSKRQALKLAKQNYQLAIYDCKNNSTIYID